jgi:hypothetical protein
VHDSKYGFISNAEPFSYFRQRKIYESPRSKQGKEIDEKLVAEKAVCSIVKRDVKQDELFDAYDKAQKRTTTFGNIMSISFKLLLCTATLP